MEDKSRQIEEVQLAPKQGSGSLLAAARKQQNRTVEEIADELNLSVTQIRTIELDQSEGLPEPTYVRGYIRSYARLLGLDAEKVLDNYLNPNWQKSMKLDDIPRGIGNTTDVDRKVFLTPAKVIVFLVVAASVAFLWYSGLLESLTGGSAANSPRQNQAASVANEPAATDVSEEQFQSEPGQTETTQTEPDQTTGTASVDSTSENVVSNELTLNFADTSWVDIRDDDDKRLAYKSYAQGEELIVSSDGGMSVFIGNAEGVTVSLNGQPFDLSEHREGVYAKFTVGK